MKNNKGAGKSKPIVQTAKKSVASKASEQLPNKSTVRSEKDKIKQSIPADYYEGYKKYNPGYKETLKYVGSQINTVGRKLTPKESTNVLQASKGVSRGVGMVTGSKQPSVKSAINAAYKSKADKEYFRKNSPYTKDGSLKKKK